MTTEGKEPAWGAHSPEARMWEAVCPHPPALCDPGHSLAGGQREVHRVFVSESQWAFLDSSSGGLSLQPFL